MGFVPCINRARAQALSAVLVLWAGGLAGCNAPSTPEECEALDTVEERDECYASIAVGVLQQSRTQGEELVTRIEDSTIRDFVYLQVTREVDPSTPRWCALIEEPGLASRCRILVSRPHLHRELLGQDQPGGAPPGGPPPGAQGGPGSPPPGGQGGPPPGGQGGPPPGGPPPGGAPGGSEPPPR